MKVKEISYYSVYDVEGNLLKKGFKDIEDALEYAFNKVFSGKYSEVVIKAEIRVVARR